MNLLQKYVEPLTFAAQTTLMLYGHNHRYERISAAYQNKTVTASTPQQVDGELTHVFNRPQAPVHAVVGTAGANYSPNDCVCVSRVRGASRASTITNYSPPRSTRLLTGARMALAPSGPSSSRTSTATRASRRSTTLRSPLSTSTRRMARSLTASSSSRTFRAGSAPRAHVPRHLPHSHRRLSSLAFGK